MRNDIGYLLRARNTLLWVVTTEELRVERAIAEVAVGLGYEVILWDCANGPTTLAGEPFAVPKTAGPAAPPPNTPGGAYAAIRGRAGRQLWILRDMHQWLPPGNAPAIRGLKSLARDLQDVSDRTKYAAVVVLTPQAEVPLELRNVAAVVPWPLPTRDEVAEILSDVLDAGQWSATPELRSSVVDAAVGLPAAHVASALAHCLVKNGRLDPAEIALQKKQVIESDGIGLTWYDPDPRGLDAVGGLQGVKDWLALRRQALTPEARAYGLPAPRGLFLTGIPGCGKSLLAKAVAAAWGLPLLRLDLGGLKSKWVGDSEGNIRRSLATVTAVAPCVLWVDEVEKGVSTGPQADGNVGSDQLGTLLTWQQERTGSVFAIFTANDVSGLPPELMRKGRVDEIFFVDLPTGTERYAILQVALAKYGRPRDLVDEGAWWKSLADLTENFTGSELEELVASGLFRSFSAGRELSAADLEIEAAATKPLAVTQSEKVAVLRAWANGRARNAAGLEVTTKAKPELVGTGFGRQLD